MGKPRGTVVPYTDDLICDYCYYTLYDSFGNMARKHVPGSRNDQYFVYDGGQRLLASTDGSYDSMGCAIIDRNTVCQYRHFWNSYEYDPLGRVIRQYSVAGVRAVRDNDMAVGIGDTYIRTDSTLYARYKYGPQPAYKAPGADLGAPKGAYTVDVCEDMFLRVDTSKAGGGTWPIILDPNGLYLTFGGMVQSLFYICQDSGNAAVKYYYIPFHCAEIALRLPWLGIAGSYKIVPTVPSGTPVSTLYFRSKCLNNKYLLVHTGKTFGWGASTQDPYGKAYIQGDGVINPAFYIMSNGAVPTDKYYYIPETYEAAVNNLVAQAPDKAYEIVTSVPARYRDYLMMYRRVPALLDYVDHDTSHDFIVSKYQINSKYESFRSMASSDFFIPNGYIDVARNLCADPRTEGCFKIIHSPEYQMMSYLLVHTDKLTNWGVRLDPERSYLMANGMVDSKYLIAVSPDNKKDLCYFAPVEYKFIAEPVKNDPNKAYEFISNGFN